MRSRVLLIALTVVIGLPSISSAQRLPRPRVGRRPTPEPAALPPQAEPVARALAVKRSHWSIEGYSLVSHFQMPTAGGGITAYTSVGSGTHADYRRGRHLSATIDLTASILGSPANVETAEVGTRYALLGPDEPLRPYLDLRAGFVHMFDPFTVDAFGDPSGGVGGGARYSRGFGGVGGGGFEYALTRSLALTTELSMMRSRMATYRITPGSIPNGTKFWMTTFRYTLGFKFNPVQALYLAQSPRR